MPLITLLYHAISTSPHSPPPQKIHLDIQLCLPPVTTFGVPPTISILATHRHYLIVLPVLRSVFYVEKGRRGEEGEGGYRNLIHCGTGRFCRAAFASLTFVRKDLLDGIVDGTVMGSLDFGGGEVVCGWCDC